MTNTRALVVAARLREAITKKIWVNLPEDLEEAASLLEGLPSSEPGYASIPYIHRENLARCLRWHPKGLESWSLADWSVALAGEVGELCNVVKKLNRVRDGLVGNKENPAELAAALAKEAADVYLYLDLFAAAAGFRLEEAIRDKFNQVSIRNGFPERL